MELISSGHSRVRALEGELPNWLRDVFRGAGWLGIMRDRVLAAFGGWHSPGPESLLRARAERMVRQAAENDARQAKELGPFGQRMPNQGFGYSYSLVSRELRRQCSELRLMFAPAG